MPKFLTISVGPTPDRATPVLASADEQAVDAAIRAICARLGWPQMYPCPAPARIALLGEEDGSDGS